VAQSSGVGSRRIRAAARSITARFVRSCKSLWV
jgi:hypothetical protein